MKNHITSRFGFTLIEMLVVLTMAAMILTATLMIYQRVRGSAAILVGHMEQSQLEHEILQKIAEDIDRLAAPGFEATIKFRNKLDNGYYSGQLVLENSYYGSGDKKQTFEQIVWQTWYSPEDDVLYLYRMHDGLNVEDKVLEKNPEDSPSAGLYIPVARGVTFFELRVQQGENILSAWTADKLPKAVRVGISFTPLQELPDDKVGVPEEAKTYRTIAIDRTRMIPYQFIKRDLDLDVLDEEAEDPNSVSLDETSEGDESKEE
ncbi:MAG: type II secretion system protein [Phycisphaerae bacterium]|nr:type II secretion system protein [Phycisphaerae bacterium]